MGQNLRKILFFWFVPIYSVQDCRLASAYTIIPMYRLAYLDKMPALISAGYFFNHEIDFLKIYFYTLGLKRKADAQPTLDKTGQRSRRQANYESPLKSGSLLESLC